MKNLAKIALDLRLELDLVSVSRMHMMWLSQVESTVKGSPSHKLNEYLLMKQLKFSEPVQTMEARKKKKTLVEKEFMETFKKIWSYLSNEESNRICQHMIPSTSTRLGHEKLYISFRLL